MKYKCVPAPTSLSIDKKGNFDSAVRSYANLINNEASDGWEFHSMENITVTQNPGCISGLLYHIPIIGNLLGKPPITLYFNMLVFSNVSDKASSISNKNNKNEEKSNKKCLKCNKYYDSEIYTSCPICENKDVFKDDIKYINKEMDKIWESKFIIIDSLEIKNIPDNNSETILKLNKDEIITYLDQANEDIKTKIIWYKIKYQNIEGWCDKNKLKKHYD